MNQTNKKIEFSITFPVVTSTSVKEVWSRLSCYLKAQRSLPEKFEISQLAGHAKRFKSEQYLKLTADEIAQLIIERDLNGFRVNSGSFRRLSSMDFWLTDAKNLGSQASLYCQIEANAKSPKDWKSLIEQIIETIPSIGAWQWRGLYYYWQGSVNPEVYVRNYGELPPQTPTYIKKSIDGIGPDRVLIDTSRNPGRTKELITTIRFHPTSEIWLGPHFWQYAKCTKEEVLAADFFIEIRDTPHFLYLKCWQEPFTRPDGEQGRMQQRLWKLFFHEDCEWPPASGTICDEPMYGPPELMPGYQNQTLSPKNNIYE